MRDREDQSLPQAMHKPSTSKEKPDGDKDEKTEYYDSVYFDSSGSSGEDETRGEEEEEGRRGRRGEEGQRREKRNKKVEKLTNDELFYDPHMDEEDEKWVARQRMAYHNGEFETLTTNV